MYMAKYFWEKYFKNIFNFCLIKMLFKIELKIKINKEKQTENKRATRENGKFNLNKTFI